MNNIKKYLTQDALDILEEIGWLDEEISLLLFARGFSFTPGHASRGLHNACVLTDAAFNEPNTFFTHGEAPLELQEHFDCLAEALFAQWLGLDERAASPRKWLPERESARLNKRGYRLRYQSSNVTEHFPPPNEPPFPSIKAAQAFHRDVLSLRVVYDVEVIHALTYKAVVP